jgi:hypothetical protein
MRELHSRGRDAALQPLQDTNGVLAQAAIGGVADVCVYHRRIDAHPSAARHACGSGDLDHATEQVAQRGSIEKLAQAHHRLGVGHGAVVDLAEVPVHHVATDFPLQRLVAPPAHVLEHEHPQSRLRGRPRPAHAAAVGPSLAHDRDDAVDEHVVLKQLVEPP